MIPFNVDFFDLKMNNIHHDGVSDIDIDMDYLSLSSNTIDIDKTDLVKEKDLLYIGSPYNFFGIITGCETKETFTTVTFEPFISIFKQNILIDTTYQNNNSIALESVIKDAINRYWVNSGDVLQNVTGLTVTKSSDTTNWNLSILPMSDEDPHAIVALYEKLICGAMKKYGITLTVTPDFNNKKINLNIGKINTPKFVVDADLNNVKINTFSLKKPNSNVNKLEVWDSTNYSTPPLYYYLHFNGLEITYDTNNTNRVTPVVLEITTVSSSSDRTFANAAKEAADSTFNGVEWENLIELEVDLSDELVTPLSLQYGQKINILHEGVMYTSILTGKQISDRVILIFGTVRHDLTKILKSGG